MKSVPYSPFNKTYKYLCLQHQLAHNKNKKAVKGLTDSNIEIEKHGSSFNKTSQSLNKTGTSFTSYRSIGDMPKGSLKK